MKIIYGFPTTGKTEAQRFANNAIDSDDFWEGNDTFNYDKFYNAIKYAAKESSDDLIVYTNLWDILLDIEHMYRVQISSITGFVRENIKDVVYLFQHVRKDQPEDIMGNPNYNKGWDGITAVYSKYLSEAKVGLSDIATRIDINIITLKDKNDFIVNYMEVL